jgi:hypothetical protein
MGTESKAGRMVVTLPPRGYRSHETVNLQSVAADAERLFCTMPAATTTPRELESFASFHRNVVKLQNPKPKLVVTGFAEGASSQCVLDNRSLMSQELFDRLDEVFK